MVRDTWDLGDSYESYVGRWSRQVAPLFVRWLDQPDGLTWLDVGCGTGALTGTVLSEASPASATGIDPSEGFLALARQQVPHGRFEVGDAQELPVPDDSADVVVSGLVLNFVPDKTRALSELARVVRPGGTVAAYVWDYAEGMELMRHFWDVAGSLDPTGLSLDEGTRFPICKPDALAALWASAGFSDVSGTGLEISTEFADFDDYWTPFLGGQGAAPAYAMSLSEEQRAELREALRARLPFDEDGGIRLTARAWAVRGLAL